MRRPPASLKAGIFSRNVIVDMLWYGFVMGVTCLLSFVAMVYGAGHGDLGEHCNKTYVGCEVICEYALVGCARVLTKVDQSARARWCLLFLPCKTC